MLGTDDSCTQEAIRTVALENLVEATEKGEAQWKPRGSSVSRETPLLRFDLESESTAKEENVDCGRGPKLTVRGKGGKVRCVYETSDDPADAYINELLEKLCVLALGQAYSNGGNNAPV